MFRSYDHPQGAHFVPCKSYSLKHSVVSLHFSSIALAWCNAQQAKLSNIYKNTRLKLFKTNAAISLSVLNCNFSKEQSVLPEDDRMIETRRSVLSVLDY